MSRLFKPKYPSAEICHNIVSESKYMTYTALSKEYGLSKHYTEKILDEFACMTLEKIKIKLECIWDEYEYLKDRNENISMESRKISSKKYYEKNKDKIKKYYSENIDKMRVYHREYQRVYQREFRKRKEEEEYNRFFCKN